MMHRVLHSGRHVADALVAEPAALVGCRLDELPFLPVDRAHGCIAVGWAAVVCNA
jgi:hypothetical protein